MRSALQGVGLPVVLGLVSLIVVSRPAEALTVEFDYRFDRLGFFGNPAARGALAAAGGAFAGLTDRLAEVVPDPSAGRSWSVSMLDPGSISRQVTVTDEFIPADSILVFVGASPSFPGVLGVADGGFDLQVAGDQAFVDTFTSRGQGTTTGAAATDTAPWGGAIWFNSNVNWSFALEASQLGPGEHDFLTTATHEIAHLLGIGQSDAWFASLSSDGRSFLGPAAMALYGGPVPLDRFASHLAEGVMGVAANGPQEALMDPSTPAGVRQLMTDIDYALLQDIGWEVTPVPLPPAALLLAGGLAVIGRSRRVASTAWPGGTYCLASEAPNRGMEQAPAGAMTEV
jgi:hypothetical protein